MENPRLTNKPELGVVHITHDMAEISGGIPAVIRQLSNELKESSPSINNRIIHSSGKAGIIRGADEIYGFPACSISKSWLLGRGLRDKLRNISRSKDTIFHIHGVWSAPQYFGAIEAQRSDIPFLVSAHGMLEPWLWSKQGLGKYLKKKLYWKTMAYPAFRDSAILHAITPLEKTHFQRLFPNKKIVVIPNAIEIPMLDSSSKLKIEKKILFLGRLEPKKGVHLLLEAFANSSIASDWTLNVVGPTWSDKYQKKLQGIVDHYKLNHRVKFLGPVFGIEKEKLLRESWVMVTPSYSEVVGLVNLEASANCLPTITTHQTGLYNWEQGGGQLIEPEINSVKLSLEQACQWNEEERRERGLASRELVKKHYSWAAVLPLWVELYNDIRT